MPPPQPAPRPLDPCAQCALAEARQVLEAERFRLLVENSSDILIILDQHGTIRYQSPSIEHLLGHKPEDRIGKNIFHSDPLVHPDDVAQKRAFLDAMLRNPARSITAEFRLRHADGSWRHIEAVGRNLLQDPHVSGIVANYRDITARKRVEEELRQAKAVTEAATRAKDHFLAVLSHELRTPLAPVLMEASAMLTDPRTPIEHRLSWKIVRDNIELEARLIDDLLDVTRIMRGKMVYQFEAVDIHALVHRTLAIRQSDALAKQIRVALDLSAAAHHVHADPARLQQVLWNLLKNAIKFSPEGSEIRILSHNRDGRLVVAVVDQGMGIEPDALARIFESFEQSEESIKRRFGGLGLGLAISRSIVEAHGGCLSASSPGRDQGATLTFDLATIAPPVLGADPTPEPRDGRRPQRPLRVLLVEDDPTTARIMTKLLRRNGYIVTIAHSLTEAYEVVSQEYDVVVSDIGLPDGNGLDLMRRIRARNAIPGIAVTGFGRDEDLQKSREAGFVAHLTKPIDFQRLEAEIQRVTAMAAE